jgi:hypothetical protein
MYSYDLAGSEFWKSMCYVAAKKGMTDTQIEELLCSKYMRWMFDKVTNEFDELCEKLLSKDAVDWAINESHLE